MPYLADEIMRLSRQIKGLTEYSLKEYGIGTGQLQILLHLYKAPEQLWAQKDIVKALGIDKGNISRSLTKLVEKGWLNVHDNRYLLTKEGVALKAHLADFFIKTQSQMTRDIAIEDLEITLRTLVKMGENMEENL